MGNELCLWEPPRSPQHEATTWTSGGGVGAGSYSPCPLCFSTSSQCNQLLTFPTFGPLGHERALKIYVLGISLAIVATHMCHNVISWIPLLWSWWEWGGGCHSSTYLPGGVGMRWGHRSIKPLSRPRVGGGGVASRFTFLNLNYFSGSCPKLYKLQDW